MYYIIKQGVYIQGVYGPYETREEAAAKFNEAAVWGKRTDFDGYHEYILVDSLGEIIGSDGFPGSKEHTLYERLEYKER